MFVRYKVQVKVRFTLEQAMKAPIGSRGIALLFLLPWHSMKVGGQRHTPVSLSPGSVRYPLYRRLSGPWAVLDRYGKSRPY